MSVTAIARRYAEALADVAFAHDQVEQIDAEVRSFAEMMQTSRDLHHVFASPVIGQDEKAKVLNALIERAKPGAMTANLLRALLNHHRLQHLGEVYEQFRRKVNERKGTVLAEVTTAAPVGPSEQQRLGDKLRELLGQQVQLQFKTDESIIGGVITRVGSVIYDGSIRTQLQGIKERLKTGY